MILFSRIWTTIRIQLDFINLDISACTIKLKSCERQFAVFGRGVHPSVSRSGAETQ